MNNFFLFILFFTPYNLNSYGNTTELIVWNVGQGQWVTYMDSNTCLHIDMGGEKAPINKVLRACHDKENQLLVTHADYDHISFIRRYNYVVPNLCLLEKIKLPNHIKINLCTKSNDIYKKISWTASRRFKLKRNDLSSVYRIKNVLIPGDSTKRQEKLWSRRVDYATKWLVLGHHGSNTSTSKYVLDKYLGLKGTVASARLKKYKHPHKKVLGRLKRRGLPNISTEHWGNVHIIL